MSGAAPQPTPENFTPAARPRSVPPELVQVFADAQNLHTAVSRLPVGSPARTRILNDLQEATRLAAPLLNPPAVGWSPGEAIRGAYQALRRAYDQAKRTAYALLNLPAETIREAYRRIDRALEIPGEAFREWGGTIRHAVDRGLETLERVWPILANVYGQVATGLGAGLIVAGVFLIWYFFKK